MVFSLLGSSGQDSPLEGGWIGDECQSTACRGSQVVIVLPPCRKRAENHYVKGSRGRLALLAQLCSLRLVPEVLPPNLGAFSAFFL